MIDRMPDSEDLEYEDDDMNSRNGNDEDSTPVTDYDHFQINNISDGFAKEFRYLLPDRVYDLFKEIAQQFENATVGEIFSIALNVYIDNQEFAIAKFEEKVKMIRAYRELHSKESHGSELWKDTYEFNNGKIYEPSFEPPDEEEA